VDGARAAGRSAAAPGWHRHLFEYGNWWMASLTSTEMRDHTTLIKKRMAASPRNRSERW
jgi:hypothetical protein